MSTTQYACTMPADVAALDGQLGALHAERAEIAEQLKAADAERARLDGVLEDGADAAYDRAAAVVRTLRRRMTAIDAAIADVGQRLHAAHVAILKAEEQGDEADREDVERALAHAAEALAAYEQRLKDRWNRRNELGLRMPSRLDAIPARRVHQLAARHFCRFGLGSPLEAKRIG